MFRLSGSGNHLTNRITKFFNDGPRAWDSMSFASVEEDRGVRITDVVKSECAVSKRIYQRERQHLDRHFLHRHPHHWHQQRVK